MAAKKPIKVLKDFDDILHLMTGKRVKDIAPRAIELFGEEIMRTFFKEKAPKLDPDDPYAILEVRPDASDLVLKAVYRAKANLVHPDKREDKDDTEFKRLTAAYEKIKQIRLGN